MTVPAEEARITPQMLCAPVEAVGVKGGEAGALTVDGEVIEVRGCESQRSERRTLRSAIGNGATAKRRRRNDKHRSETANFGRQTSEGKLRTANLGRQTSDGEPRAPDS